MMPDAQRSQAAAAEGTTLPALLRGGWLAYGAAVDAALAAVGCDDMPRNGSYVISPIARTAIRSAVDGLGAALEAQVGAEYVSHARVVLAELASRRADHA